MGHPIERRAMNQRLGGLDLQIDAQTGGRQKETKDGRFCQRAQVVVRSLFPSFASTLSNSAQVVILFESLGFGVTMLPNAAGGRRTPGRKRA